jgi:hypothetical protein
MTEGGDLKDDLQLPSGTDEAEKLAVVIRQDFDAGKELSVSVMKVGLEGVWVVAVGCVGWSGVCLAVWSLHTLKPAFACIACACTCLPVWGLNNKATRGGGGDDQPSTIKFSAATPLDADTTFSLV